MRVAVDLHIHSALSPCADCEMTPNNIVNMGYIKGLDVIAVTDHNSAENCEALAACAAERNILFIPGMEVESREEVHLVCLFPDTGAAKKMQQIVYDALPKLENRAEIYGEQLVMDSNDNIVTRCDRMLLTAADLGVEEIRDHVDALGGVVIPAHVDRDSFSVLSNLGAIPPELNVKYVEISKNCVPDALLKTYPSLEKYGLIKSSDAHYLCDILERETFLEIESKDVNSIIVFFKKA